MIKVTQELAKVAMMPVVRYRGTLIPEPYVTILSLLGEGWSNLEIANHMELSTRTVEGLIGKIRDLVVSMTGERLSERRLVIFGREMLDGYQAFLRLRDHEKLNNWGLSDIELIEDWDDDEDLPGLDTDTDEPQSENRPEEKVVDLRQYRHEYEITNFEAEERELIYSNGTHYLV